MMTEGGLSHGRIADKRIELVMLATKPLMSRSIINAEIIMKDVPHKSCFLYVQTIGGRMYDRQRNYIFSKER